MHRNISIILPNQRPVSPFTPRSELNSWKHLKTTKNNMKSLSNIPQTNIPVFGIQNSIFFSVHTFNEANKNARIKFRPLGIECVNMEVCHHSFDARIHISLISIDCRISSLNRDHCKVMRLINYIACPLK